MLVVIVLGMVVLLGVGSTLAWHLHAAAARDGVAVLSDQDALTCVPRSAVTRASISVGDDSGQTLAVPAVRISGPTTCQLRFVVVNEGSEAVQVDAVHLAGLYPLSGLKVANSNDGPLHGGTYSLEPGEAIAPSIAISWQAGCIPNGNTDFNPDSPTVTLTADGLTGTAGVRATAYAVLGTKYSETRCPWRQ